MCGIAGVVGPNAGRYEEDVARMVECQMHRGPDDSGIHVTDGCVLGHRRLSIIDPSPAGHQPFVSENGRYSLVFNGEIYNYRTLGDALQSRGYEFVSQSDTEVLFNALIEWGRDAVEHLNGDFAYGFYDRKRRQCLVARDRFGVKPFYWTRLGGDSIAFASEATALLECSGVDSELNESVLAEFLATQSVSPPETLLKSVRMLEPGSRLKFSDGELAITEYWNPLEIAEKSVVGNNPKTADDVVPKVRSLLEQAVERQLVSDVPIGAFLSGGIDSSLLVGLMSRVSDEPLRTLSVAFEDSRFEDAEYARLASERFGTRHEEVRLSDDEILEQVPSAVASQDHPSADGINTYIVSRAAREKGLKVAISGLGGDELFGGYSTFERLERLELLRPFITSVPKTLRSAIGSLIQGTGSRVATKKIGYILGTDWSLAETYETSRRVFGEERIGQILRADVPGTRRSEKKLSEVFSSFDEAPLYAKISYAEARSYMHNVLLRDTDQMGLANSLEVRVPLLDKALAEFVFSLPDSTKKAGDSNKGLLTLAAEDILPEEIINRPKQGFVLPFAKWMRGPLRDFCEQAIESLAREPAFEGRTVRRYWRRFLEGERGLSWSRLWLLVVLGRWIEREL